MARIAGVFSSWPITQKTHALGCLLEHFSASAPKASHAICGQAALGGAVAEGTDSAVAVRGALAVAVDGFIFNAHEFGAFGKPAAEIFIALYEKYGFREALIRINGDFAVSLHDSNTGSLWLARDRVGVKPLYFAQKNGAFAFASQPGALLKFPGISRRLNRRFAALFAGSHYRTFDNIPDESPFADIVQLQAGHVLEMKLSGPIQLSRYWTLVEKPELVGSVEALADQYRDLLTDAVRLRLKASKAPAFLLSGGMDSSSVLACAVAVSGEKFHAFSSVYEDSVFDESKEIHSMLEGHVKQWHPVIISAPEIFSIVKRMVRAHDEPVATATWLSHYLLCEDAAAQGFGAFFGGLGGDELNAGEYEYFFPHFADLNFTGEHETLQREVKLWAAYHDHPIYRKNMLVVEKALQCLVDRRVPGLCLPDQARLGRYAPAVNPDFFDLPAFTPVMDNPFRSYLKNRTYQDIFRETAPCCLRAEDRQTSAFGLQHFDPFFDHRLIEFMFQVPGRLKIRDGITKILLREATRGLLPEGTRTRIKKTGWNAPAHVWFSGVALEEVRDMVNSRDFRAQEIYNVTEVLRIIDDHRNIVSDHSPRENHMMFLWQLLNLEFWLRSIENL
jgi:asparagine synthase (glutamine-hydrolysing)